MSLEPEFGTPPPAASGSSVSRPYSESAPSTSRSPAVSHDSTGGSTAQSGMAFALLAYCLWGLFPLLFHALAPATPLEIVSQRVVWCLLFCGIVIGVMRAFSRAKHLTPLRSLSWRTWGLLVLASLFVLANWLIYVIAVASDHVLEASLGYFINPLVTVAIGCVALREKLTRPQVVALTLGAAAVAVICIGYGAVPWLSLGLAVSFGGYSYLKKQVGSQVDAMTGLTAETTVLAPFALGYLVYLTVTGSSTFTTEGGTHVALLMISGVATALPLLSFAAAAKRTSLTILGLTQYITPVIQFALGLWYFQEPMTQSRWIGFGLVWLGIMVLAWDSVRTYRQRNYAAHV